MVVLDGVNLPGRQVGVRYPVRRHYRTLRAMVTVFSQNHTPHTLGSQSPNEKSSTNRAGPRRRKNLNNCTERPLEGDAALQPYLAGGYPVSSGGERITSLVGVSPDGGASSEISPGGKSRPLSPGGMPLPSGGASSKLSGLGLYSSVSWARLARTTRALHVQGCKSRQRRATAMIQFPRHDILKQINGQYG